MPGSVCSPCLSRYADRVASVSFREEKQSTIRLPGCRSSIFRIRVGGATITTPARFGRVAGASRVDDAILETRGLTKEFRGFNAVQGVELKIRRGTTPPLHRVEAAELLGQTAGLENCVVHA